MLLSFEEGDPASRRSPDVFIVRGIEKRDRRSFKTWEEAATPCLVVEVTSKGTWLEDTGTKKALYESLGVQEYLLFDPLEEYLKPRFQVFGLERRGYAPRDLALDGSYRSPALGITFRPTASLLRVARGAAASLAGRVTRPAARARRDRPRHGDRRRARQSEPPPTSIP